MTTVDWSSTEKISLGKKLRVLDGLEEYLWLVENTRPRPAMMFAEVEGPTTVEVWQDALRKVQQRYPLFSARIRKNAGERPYFEALPNVPLSLRVLPLEGTDLDAQIAEEAATSFGKGEDLLVRVTLLHSKARCAILLVTHHAAYDGRTNVHVMKDLIAAASGEALGDTLPFLPEIGELFGLGEPELYTELAPVKTSDAPFHLPKPKIQRRILRTENLKGLRACARSEGTTVQGALLAAFFLADRRSLEQWRNAPVSCVSDQQLRRSRSENQFWTSQA